MEEITKQGKKGFTDFQLKYIAMDLMILDHIEFMDGETAILVAGVVMYLTRRHRILQVISYVIVAALFDVVLPLIQYPGLTTMDFLTQVYQWMEVFSIVFMLAYNGQRGHGFKRLFYWFYPVHVYVLYGLSCLVYGIVK